MIVLQFIVGLFLVIFVVMAIKNKSSRHLYMPFVKLFSTIYILIMLQDLIETLFSPIINIFK